MEELATEAGVGVRTLYRHYGSRRALLTEAGVAPRSPVRTRVLAAGLELVGRDGLAALSMDDLAASVGISRATLYRLFPGKTALFEALVAEFSPWGPVADVLETAPDGNLDQVIPAVAEAIADALANRAGLLLQVVRELITEAPDTAAGSRQAMTRGLPDLIAYLQRQMSAGHLRRMSPVLACQLLVGPILAATLTQPLATAADPDCPCGSQLLEEIVRAWRLATGPDRPPPAC